MNLNFIKSKNISKAVINLIAVGFISILGQVVILRELVVAFFGIELIYILSLAVWMIGTALGAAIGKRSSIPGEKKIHVLFLLTAIGLLIDIVFVRGIRIIFGGVSGGYLPFTIQMLGLVIALFPVSFLTGLLFQWCAKVFVSENETLAKAYSIESIGGILGGLASTLFLSLGCQNFLIALLCGLATSIIVLFNVWKEKRSKRKYFSCAIALLMLTLVGINNVIDYRMTSWNHTGLIDSKDTPYNRTTITKSEEQICVFEDDALSYETENISAEEFIQLSTLQTKSLKNILVLGSGFQGIINELLKLPVDRIDYVEINKKMIDVLKKHLPGEQQKFLKDPKVNLIYQDPRQFLEKKNLYNVIIVGMPEPSSAQNNRFYTKEFFQQCSNRLTGNGIMSFKIISSENLWTTQLLMRNRSIYKALKTEFKNAIVLPGVTNIFIASKSGLNTDTKILTETFNKRNLQTKLVSPQYINYIFKNDRFTAVQKMLNRGTLTVNTDLQPACYSFTISIWLSKFFPELAQLEDDFSPPNNIFKYIIPWIVLAFIVCAIFFGRKKILLRRFILVFLVGFIGIILESVLLLNFQSKNGNLYQDIGILLMMFMLGLALGSYFVNNIFDSSNPKTKNKTQIGIVLILLLALLNLIVHLFVRYEFLDSLLLTSVFLLLSGFFVSAVFAFAGLYKIENQKKIISILYSADLFGGSIGSLAAALFFIPGFGLSLKLLLIAVFTFPGILFFYRLYLRFFLSEIIFTS